MLPLAETFGAWDVVVVLGMLASLAFAAVAFIRQVSGRAGERQIEPTQLAALSGQIAGVARDLGGINRELGEVRAIGERTEEALNALGRKQHDDMSGVHKRIDAISDRVSGHDARIHSLERIRS